MGKVVVSPLLGWQQQAPVAKGGTALVLGGTGYLGLLVALRLAQQGASHVVLASRSGRLAISGASASVAAQLLQHATCSVSVVQCDVGASADLAALLSGRHPVLGGRVVQEVVHAGGVLQDGLLGGQVRGGVFGPFVGAVLVCLHCTFHTLLLITNMLSLSPPPNQLSDCCCLAPRAWRQVSSAACA